ncbi:reverse transcriptase-like protein [Weissella viridescens]|uniref:reverse transcriptase-like protein n=1 Tax=Weissella viridescens TaxID=1629 RepID=UPI0025773285|nr:reverse transcriptase-like protein [Weissella viridescens]WJI90867.1 reverse transcriptase-like protein [Weissella viridescens]
MIYHIYFDAATRGQNGPSAAGAIIIANHSQTPFKTTLSTMSNHAAEFAAARFALACVAPLANQNDTLMLHSDSKIVIDSLTKGFAKHFMAEVTDINQQLDQYRNVILEWLPEKQNQGAHQLANQALATI